MWRMPKLFSFYVETYTLLRSVVEPYHLKTLEWIKTNNWFLIFTFKTIYIGKFPLPFSRVSSFGLEVNFVVVKKHLWKHTTKLMHRSMTRYLLLAFQPISCPIALTSSNNNLVQCLEIESVSAITALPYQNCTIKLHLHNDIVSIQYISL